MGQPYNNTDIEALVPEQRMRQMALDEFVKLKQQEEKNMADKQSKSGVNRHKRLAMGEKIELKKGGMAKKPKSKKK